MKREKVTKVPKRKTRSKTGIQTADISIDVRLNKKDYGFITDRIKRDLHGKQCQMPVDIPPMLATITKEPFNNSDWLFEIKWDGYRCISYLNRGVVQLKSRSNLSFNKCIHQF